MIRAGLLDQLEALGWQVNCPERLPSYEHLQPPNGDSQETKHPKLKNVDFVSRVTEVVHGKVKKACKAGHLALTLGGDHSLGMATVSAGLAVYPNLGIIWVDAHADINTAETTESGNLHGCPVSFLMGIGPPVKGFNWLKPCLKKNKLVYIGLRDVDAGNFPLLSISRFFWLSLISYIYLCHR
jgi:arginase